MLAELSAQILFYAALLLSALTVFILAWIGVKKADSFWGDYETVFMDSATVNLQDMFLFVDPKRLFLLNALALVIVPLIALMLTGDWLIALLVFVAVMTFPFNFYKSMRKKRLRRLEQQLPEVLVMVSGSLSSGASLNMALESMLKEQPAPIAQEFMLFMREQRIGVDFDVSLRNMERRIPLQDFLMFTAAMRISREVGGNLGEVLTTLAETLRRKATMEGKIESLTAQGRMQGIVMAGLPILLGVLLFFMEPVAMAKLFTTTIGWGVLGVIIAMEVVGYIFIRKITSIDV
ncbi:MAG: secretion system protein F [Candidatus Thioglobus sp.]|nr:MAG: secretion system protein F [Candidatus Thioglobus sp.]|tara:strand:+ start:447 stop:1319 length:873 start_codon:yes stop_codon:yes gene_type:complete